MKEHEKNKTTLQKQLKRIQIIALISFGIALIAMQKKNEFFSNFIVRIIGWFPCDILSFYFGATATPYPVYLGASLLGASIGVITNTLLGDVILNPLSPQFAIMIAIKIAVSAAAFGVAYRLNKKENQNGEQKNRRSER